MTQPKAKYTPGDKVTVVLMHRTVMGVSWSVAHNRYMYSVRDEANGWISGISEEDIEGSEIAT